MQRIFETYARYNARMNKQFYGIAAQLSSQDLDSDCGLYFQSILGTLNHIAVGDIIWLKRFAHHLSELSSLDYVRELNTPEKLDTVLHASLDPLTQLRGDLDHCIINFIDELNSDQLSSTVGYSNVKAIASNKKLELLLIHFFNHQTHHRGQISAALSQAGLDIGITDLLLEIPNE